MAVRLYSEYIKVDPNFIPVFSRNSDRTYPDKWQSFYPHASFKNILKDIVETLEKSSETKDRSVWMSGAYGTGKTYASFVIKHILEDDIDSITPYFTQNGMESLLARVKGVRAKGRILVVQRSASAGINTQDKLFNSIVESVRKAVSDAGLTYTGAESLADKVLTMLKHPESSAFNFQGAFNKYRGKFTEYGSVDSIIKDLEELDLDDKLGLLDTIIEVAALEGFNWSMSSEELVDWLEDVRKGNNLYSIVFIWDEFTEYFKNNQNNITGLQEIAQASSRISCYLFLITHSSAGQLKRKSILVLKTAVAGLYYHVDSDTDEGKAFLESLKPGTELMLFRDTDNEHDKWAISVYTSDDRELGYITRFKNETIARLMDYGKVFHAYVDEPPEPPKDATEARRTIAPTENYKLPFSVYMED